MKSTRILMNMPITVEVCDEGVSKTDIDSVFDYFEYIDRTFSPFKPDSELSKINRGELAPEKWSDDMREVFRLSEETKKETDGYFDILTPQGKYNPSGLVKGWAIWKASNILREKGFQNLYVDAGGDIETSGKNSAGSNWRLGIRNPFEKESGSVVCVVSGENLALATSGTYERGGHIYNPKTKNTVQSDIISLSVIGPNIFEADRFATACFAMGRQGIYFLEKLPGFEAYMIDTTGIATETSGWIKYLQ